MGASCIELPGASHRCEIGDSDLRMRRVPQVCLGFRAHLGSGGEPEDGGHPHASIT